jgi:glycosyltransferase involved in cell wall biosynthesis
VVTSDVNVKLDIYGDGTYRKNVEKLISENGLENFVEMHGKVPDGWKQLYQADCFVFPSRYEGFSGALVEAMMTGIPIIASDIPMNLEAVDEQTALIFPVMNAEVLASKMVEMKNNYAQYIAMGQTARKVSMERFEIRSVSAQYEQFLKEVVLNKVDKADLI